jgi:hypothetical protein
MQLKQLLTQQEEEKEREYWREYVHKILVMFPPGKETEKRIADYWLARMEWIIGKEISE